MKFYISLSYALDMTKNTSFFYCELKFKVPIYIYIYIEREREREREEQSSYHRCRVQKFNKVIMPHVIPKVEEANTVPRSPYTQIIRSKRRAMATSMAYYKRGPHYKGRVSRKGLALT